MQMSDHMEIRIRTSVLRHGNSVRTVARRWGLHEGEVAMMCGLVSPAPAKVPEALVNVPQPSFSDLMETSINKLIAWACEQNGVPKADISRPTKGNVAHARATLVYNLSHRWGLDHQQITDRLDLWVGANVADITKRCPDKSAPPIAPPVPDLPEPYLGELTHIAKLFNSTPHAVLKGQIRVLCEARSLWMDRLESKHKIPCNAIAEVTSIPFATVHRSIQRRRAA